MAKKSKTLDLNESELRRLLLEQRRADRQRRLEAFRRGGDLVAINASPAEPRGGEILSGLRVHADPNLSLASPRAAKFRTWIDRTLLMVEFLAVLGLGFIFLTGINLLRDLNNEVSGAFAGASPSPTPLIGPVVLPSGHTPPNAGEPAQPNEAEIPEYLRPQVQAYTAAIVIPTPGPEQALGIKISAIGVSAPVVQGDGWEELKRGAGQHVGSANPGQPGNMVLTGHDDIYGEIFRDLDQLKPGDEITVFTATSTYVYVVTETIIVAPTYVQVMEATPNATLTLISCYPYLIDNQRIIVKAILKS